jgi:hypothetical protein
MLIEVKMPETVESAMSSVSAISGPVIRNRRSAAMQPILVSSVRLATERGADDRSSNPSSPSARHRASHLPAVRSLIPAASDAAWTVQLPLSIRSTSNLRPFGLSRALAWIFIRCLLGTGASQPPASKEARMNNVLRNYS